MKLVELNEERFDEFVRKTDCDNFMQSIYMVHHLRQMEREFYLVGLEDDGKLVGATILEAYKGYFNQKTFEAYKGFIIDYKQKKLIKEFTDALIPFVKSKGGFRLVIDPYVPVVQRDIDANIIEGGFDNRDLIQTLLDLGYQKLDHAGQVSWVFALDINGKTSDQIFNEMKTNAKRNIKKTIDRYKLSVRELSYEDLPEFKKLTEDTGKRRGFNDKPLAYYQSMYLNFKDQVRFLMVDLVFDDYLAQIEEELVLCKDKLSKLKDESKKEKVIETIEKLNENKLEALSLKEKHGDKIVLSGGMFILYGNETVYLFSGSYDEFMSFSGQFRIQWEMIQYACNKGYKRHNFYGIRDVFDKNSENYGVYAFKKMFNGYVEELMGSYEIKTSSFYSVYKLMKKLKG